jgi:hypothetical protein
MVLLTFEKVATRYVYGQSNVFSDTESSRIDSLGRAFQHF